MGYKPYKYEVGVVLGTVKIVSKTTIPKKDKKCKVGYSSQKAYVVKCLKCKDENIVTESNLTKSNKGCNTCKGNKVVVGINDISTTHQHLTKYLLNKEDGYNYTYSSGKKIKVKCDFCGEIKETTPNKLSSRGFRCSKCGDGIPYTEKFMHCLLEQLNTKYCYRYSDIWTCGKNYDFYVYDKKCIIETHGRQHYKQGFGDTARRVEEEIENDIFKRKLALLSGIDNYVTIDCSESSLNWMKNNIMKSILPKLLIFEEVDINWLKCHEYACSSKVETVCNIWNEGVYDIQVISELVDIDRSTCRKYLKQGVELSLCNYSSEITNKIAREKTSKARFKKVKSIELNIVLDSAKEFEERSIELFGVQLNDSNIRAVCNKGRKSHKGYHFEYV